MLLALSFVLNGSGYVSAAERPQMLAAPSASAGPAPCHEGLSADAAAASHADDTIHTLMGTMPDSDSGQPDCCHANACHCAGSHCLSLLAQPVSVAAPGDHRELAQAPMDRYASPALAQSIRPPIA